MARRYSSIIKDFGLLKKCDSKLKECYKSNLFCLRQMSDKKIGKYFPYSWSYNQNHFTLKGADKVKNITTILNLFDIDYSFHNDSPRGGKTHTYIAVSNKDKLKRVIQQLEHYI